jgi:hypothetical protein
MQTGEVGEEMATHIVSVGRRMGWDGMDIVYRENIAAGINVCFLLLSQHNHQEREGDSSSRDTDSDSNLTDTSELAQPLAE